MVGLYFSGHWCPPCATFTPQLVEAYEKTRAAQPGTFEVVLVSCDRSTADFEAYFKTMPWLALPYEATAAAGGGGGGEGGGSPGGGPGSKSEGAASPKQALMRRYGVKGIPALVLVDAQTGLLVNESGREAVMEDPAGFPWTPKDVIEHLGETFLQPVEPGEEGPPLADYQDTDGDRVVFRILGGEPAYYVNGRPKMTRLTDLRLHRKGDDQSVKVTLESTAEGDWAGSCFTTIPRSLVDEVAPKINAMWGNRRASRCVPRDEGRERLRPAGVFCFGSCSGRPLPHPLSFEHRRPFFPAAAPGCPR